MKYKKQVNTVTGETRWVPMTEPKKEVKKTWSQKAQSIPIIGDALGTLIPVATSITALQGQGTVNKRADSLQAKAWDLSQRAKYEKDPQKKKELYAESKRLLEKSSNTVNRWEKLISGGSGSFKDRATPTSLVDSVKTYAPQATRGAVSMGTMIAPMVAGSSIPATAGKRILDAGGKGSLIGFLSGLSAKDKEDLSDRLKRGLETGAVGGVLGSGLQMLGEGGRAIKNKFVPKKVKTKGLENTNFMGEEIAPKNTQAEYLKRKAVETIDNSVKKNVKNVQALEKIGGPEGLTKNIVKYNTSPSLPGATRELKVYQPVYERSMAKAAAEAEKKGLRINVKNVYQKAKQTLLRRYKDKGRVLKGAKAYFTEKDSKFLQPNNARVKVSSAHNLLKDLYNDVGAYTLDDITPGYDVAEKSFQMELRREIQRLLPKMKYDMGKYHTLKTSIQAFKKEPAFGLTELTGMVAGPGKGVAGNAVDYAVTKTVRSPGVKRAIAKKVYMGASKASSKVSKIAKYLPKLKEAKPKEINSIVLKILVDLLGLNERD